MNAKEYPPVPENALMRYDKETSHWILNNGQYFVCDCLSNEPAVQKILLKLVYDHMYRCWMDQTGKEQHSIIEAMAMTDAELERWAKSDDISKANAELWRKLGEDGIK